MVRSPKWNTLAASTASAPASAPRTPPPTVSGMNTCSAVRRTTSYVVDRASLDAVMSRKTSSSAPSASYTCAISTGSPASRKSVKFTPLTTRPASTSRHGMTRAFVMPSTRSCHRHQVEHVVAPVVEVAVGHQQHALRLELPDELGIVGHQDHRPFPSL